MEFKQIESLGENIQVRKVLSGHNLCGLSLKFKPIDNFVQKRSAAQVDMNDENRGNTQMQGSTNKAPKTLKGF